MKIRHHKYRLKIEFETAATFDIYPTFIMRSILGMELRNLTCLFKDRKCENCDLNSHCAYSWLFETPIDKSNNFMTGRNRAPHPFVFGTDAGLNEDKKEINLELTLFGKAIDYFPYIYYALSKAGEKGVLKKRTKFKIVDITSGPHSILKQDGSINTKVTPNEWSLNDDEQKKESNIKIDFKTPYRLKKNGKYVSTFEYPDIINSISRRVKILTSLYGEHDINNEHIEVTTPHKTGKQLFWTELTHYSSRQNRAMKLGGVVGSMEIEGSFTQKEMSLLKAGEIFNIGKNISFGLGRVLVGVREK